MHLTSKEPGVHLRNGRQKLQGYLRDGKVCIWKNNVKDAFSLGFIVDSLYQVDGSLLGVMSYDTSLVRTLASEVCPPSLQSSTRCKTDDNRDAQIPSRARRCMSRMCQMKAQKGTIPLKPKQDLRYITVGSLRHI